MISNDVAPRAAPFARYESRHSPAISSIEVASFAAPAAGSPSFAWTAGSSPRVTNRYGTLRCAHVNTQTCFSH